MNNYNESYPLITLYNALYIKALCKVLQMFLISFSYPIFIFEFLSNINYILNWFFMLDFLCYDYNLN